jgi:EmrB/QacA subfamily drug resistance transporter
LTAARAGGVADPLIRWHARRAWLILATTSVAVFAASLDTSIMFMAFPDIGRTFPDVSRAELSWVINAYTIVFAALLVPSGRLADRVGRRRVFFAGLAIFSLSSGLCGAAPTEAALIGARVLQAVGGSLLFPASLALVLKEFPQAKRAAAIATWSAVGALAAALGPSFGGIIIDTLDWRWAFYINLPVGAFAFVTAGRLLHESRADEPGPQPDLAGVPMLAAGVGALALGIVQSDEWGWTDLRTVGAFVTAAAILPLFILRCSTHPSPTLDLTLFREHNFRLANVATLAFAVSFSAMFFGLVQFLVYVWGYSILEAGLTIWPGPLTASVVAVLGGRFVDRVGYRVILPLGSAFFITGSLWLMAFTEVEPNLWGVWVPSALLTGTGVGLAMPSLSSAAVRSLPPNRYAVGSAVNQTIRTIGSVFGVALAVALLGQLTPAEVLDAFDRVWLLMVAGALTAGIVSLFLRQPVPVVLAISDDAPSSLAVARRGEV